MQQRKANCETYLLLPRASTVLPRDHPPQSYCEQLESPKRHNFAGLSASDQQELLEIRQFWQEGVVWEPRIYRRAAGCCFPYFDL